MEDQRQAHFEKLEKMDKDLFEKDEEIAIMKFRNEKLSQSES